MFNPPACRAAEPDSFQQYHDYTGEQEQVIGEEPPDQQGKAFGSAGEDSVEIVHKAALLGTAGAGKGSITGADKEQEAQGQQFVPGSSGKPEGMVDKDNGTGQRQQADCAAQALDLYRNRDIITDYEILKGSMDDVFLNLTGREMAV